MRTPKRSALSAQQLIEKYGWQDCWTFCFYMQNRQSCQTYLETAQGSIERFARLHSLTEKQVRVLFDFHGLTKLAAKLQNRVLRIYVLIDPRSNKFHYVGKTVSSLSKRLEQHVYELRYRTSQTKRDNWLRVLSRHGLGPKIKLLQKTTCANSEVEEFWIRKLFLEGHPLTNGTFREKRRHVRR